MQVRVSRRLKRKVLNDAFPIVGLATFDYDLEIIDDFGDAESPRNYQYSSDAFPAREALSGSRAEEVVERALVTRLAD